MLGGRVAVLGSRVVLGFGVLGWVLLSVGLVRGGMLRVVLVFQVLLLLDVHGYDVGRELPGGNVDFKAPVTPHAVPEGVCLVTTTLCFDDDWLTNNFWFNRRFSIIQEVSAGVVIDASIDWLLF